MRRGQRPRRIKVCWTRVLSTWRCGNLFAVYGATASFATTLFIRGSASLLSFGVSERPQVALLGEKCCFSFRLLLSSSNQLRGSDRPSQTMRTRWPTNNIFTEGFDDVRMIATHEANCRFSRMISNYHVIRVV